MKTSSFYLNFYGVFVKKTFFIILLTYSIFFRHIFFKIRTEVAVEFLLILLFVCFFASGLLSAWDLVISFVLLEGLTLSCILLMVHLFSPSSVEATLKYFIFNVLATGCFLMGTFLISYSLLYFFNIDDLNFNTIAIKLFELRDAKLTYLALALNFILFTFFFKLAVFPIHG